MGNSSTKESRGPDLLSPHVNRQPESPGGTSGPASPSERVFPSSDHARSGRATSSRPDLSFLGLGTSSNTSNAQERRETKQEREARKLEKERVARIKERERSLKDEHIDGGYLVTMGVYTGTEDFNKAAVRQLMIERRIAPFWRGLNDFREDLAEHQLIAAGRGLPIPAADEIPQEELMKPSNLDSPHGSTQNIQNPIAGQSQSAASDTPTSLSPSHPAFNLSSPGSTPTSPPHSSPFRPRSKTLASLTTSSKNASSTEMVPREIQLPKDPFVNGQAIEAFLYKDAAECPICFLYYPPYLNKTRCCDQAICSECFVQIKRPDPHPPEHEHNDPSNPSPAPQTSESPDEPESLVSEPATCPYCQQSEFGVTYDAPPFRRGLSYSNPGGLATFPSAMSSTSSINSANNPATLTPHTQKRRTTSISATASTVITTDKIRPDWATKLTNARSHLARRSAAATALHTAAYLMGSGSTDTRSFGFSGRSRFGRSRTENSSSGHSGTATPSASTAEPNSRAVSDQIAQMRREAAEPGGARRRSRMDDLEEMMMMEAIRLSLAAEEERKRRDEKEAAKYAKRRVKEQKKEKKKEKRGVYGSGTSSASGSALSLALPSLGRRRGNSGGSNLAREIMPEGVESQETKGKGVDRSVPAASVPIEFSRTSSSTGLGGFPGARHLDTNIPASIPDPLQPLPSPTAPEKRSHLRTMSNASSPASSFMDSVPGSLPNEFHDHGSSSSLEGQNASGTNINGNGHTDGTPEGADSNGGAGSESMFNFRSLAAMIGHDEDDKEDAARHIEHLSGGEGSSIQEGSTVGLEESISTLKANHTNASGSASEAGTKDQKASLEPQRTESTPTLMLTPVTPAASGPGEDDGKQLGSEPWGADVQRQITQ